MESAGLSQPSQHWVCVPFTVGLDSGIDIQAADWGRWGIPPIVGQPGDEARVWGGYRTASSCINKLSFTVLHEGDTIRVQGEGVQQLMQELLHSPVAHGVPPEPQRAVLTKVMVEPRPAIASPEYPAYLTLEVHCEVAVGWQNLEWQHRHRREQLLALQQQAQQRLEVVRSRAERYRAELRRITAAACARCHSYDAGLQLCSRCESVYYCSSYCHAEDAGEHQPFCCAFYNGEAAITSMLPAQLP